MDNLRIVEIELFSFCNRKCSWCPNSFIDRKSNNYYLDNDIFENLIKELASNDYKGVFSFSRYNEPFSDFETLNEKIKFIKSYLPNNLIVTNTNGDYITKDILDEMLIDELSIMDYDCKGRDFVYDRIFFEFELKEVEEYENYFVGKYGNKKILYYFSWPESSNISDRGGSLPKYSKQKRTIPCLEPNYFIGINYDGTVSPCCNIRNDIKEHKLFIVGDLHTESLEKILNSNKFNLFRAVNNNCIYSSGMPCYKCNNKGGRYTRDEGGILYE